MGAYDKIMNGQQPLTNFTVSNNHDFFPLPKPLDWQLKALQEWENNNCKGTIKAVTGCITGDTKILCPRNKTIYPDGIPIKKLIGQNKYVYSLNLETNKLEIKLATGIRKIKKKKVYLIKTQCGRQIKATDNHLFLKLIYTKNEMKRHVPKEKQYCPVNMLKIGDYLLFGGWNSIDSWIRFNFNNNKFKRQTRIPDYRFIIKELTKFLPEKYCVHHIDGNHDNNEIENLKSISHYEHNHQHSFGKNNSMYNKPLLNHPKGFEGHNRGLCKKCNKYHVWGNKNHINKKDKINVFHTPDMSYNDDNFKLLCSEKAKEGLIRKKEQLGPQYFSEKSKQTSKKRYIDRIISITECPSEEVYDMEVADNHNFFANEFCIHNSGKSNLAYMIIQKHKPAKTLIVVHTISLQLQHKENLMKDLHIPESDIGLVGNGEEDFSKPITIAIVNSIRFDVLKNAHYDLLILDEIHHYYAEINSTFLKVGIYDKVLGLSATPERTDSLHIPWIQKYPIVYSYSQHEAIQDKIISEYSIINISTTLLPDEEEKYLVIDRFIRTNFTLFNNDFETLRRSIGHNPIAAKVMSAIGQRKQLIQNSINKIYTATELIKNELKLESKIIVFNEFIETIQTIQKLLEEDKIPHAIYHSGMKLKERKQMLEDFKNDKFRVLISAKALDEGLNVVNANVAIIVSGTSSKRQQIQRIGRVLRREEGKHAYVYQLYIKSYGNIISQDYVWLKKRSSGLQVPVIWK